MTTINNKIIVLILVLNRIAVRTAQKQIVPIKLTIPELPVVMWLKMLNFTALELINRGHRLIADDAVEIRRVSNKTLVGSAPDNIRHFIELRGVGVLNARRLFGMGAVKMTEKVDMVVQLEPWDSDKVYDRLGLENEYTEILDIKVPVTTVPVKPGRNLSIIIEAAAMNNRQKKMGYNAARELLHSLGMTDDIIPAKKELEFWHNF